MIRRREFIAAGSWRCGDGLAAQVGCATVGNADHWIFAQRLVWLFCPVIWVGLPSQRGPKASADSAYLNDLYRSRAEKSGIIYVDVWDGFVDEAGSIRNEANKAGECFLSVAQIAERAKVGRTKTRAAIRLAESYGVVTIKEAPGRRRVIVNRGCPGSGGTADKR